MSDEDAVLVTLPTTFNEYQTDIGKALGNGYQMEVALSDTVLPEDDLIKLLTGKRYFISGSIEHITKRVIEAMPSLRLIAKFGVGFDTVDLRTAAERGIFVTNVPGANSESVAELTIGLAISMLRHLMAADAMLRRGGWGLLVGEELQGKKVGLVGFGNIGKAVAKKLTVFDVSISAFDVVQDSEFARECGVNFVDLETLLRSSDVVSLHLPLNEHTRNTISTRELDLMQSHAYLINTSRGEVVDEKALIKALKEGSIAGAALDTYHHEPLEKDSWLRDSPLVVHTPHIGGSTKEAILRLVAGTTRNVKLVGGGQRPLNIVNDM